MSANDHQEGGTHYRSDLQHWDLIEDYHIGYLEGNATKYITRHAKKNGAQDLNKAIHYVTKLLEKARTGKRKARGYVGPRTLNAFFLANGITDTRELVTITILCSAWKVDQLQPVIGMLIDLREELYPDAE
jgi:hypothetical protein